MRPTAAAPQRLLFSSDNPEGPVQAFTKQLVEDHVSVRSRALYLGHLGRFRTWLRGRYGAELLDATSHDIREYRGELAGEKGQAPASVNAALAALHRFYGWASANGHITGDPTIKVKPVASQPIAPKGFSSTERQRLRREAERAGPMVDAIVTTLLNTGIRVEELVTLTWEHVKLQPRLGMAIILGKGEKLRTVPLNAAVRAALAALKPAVATGPVFRGKRGPYTHRGIRHLLAQLGRRAGVDDVHPRRFRHDAARRLVEGVDIPTVAALLGHSRLETVRLSSQPDEAALTRTTN